MKRYQIQVTESAESEIEAAYRYIHAEAPIAAARWRRGVTKAVRSLRTTPLRCRIAPESDAVNRALRQLMFGNYRILFTIDGDRVCIVHFRHAARDTMPPEEVG